MHKLSAESLLELVFVSDPRLDPGGGRAVAVVTRIRPAKGEGKSYEPPAYESRLESIDLTTGETEPFTSGTGDSSPRYSPDGRRLAFLSKRADDDAAQLYVMRTDGGEARRLTSLPAGVAGFAWRPDSGGFALLSRGDWTDVDGQEGRGRVITRKHYRGDGRGFRPGRPTSLHVLELAGDAEPREVLARETELAAVAWSPDGDSIWFTAARDPDGEDEWRSGLWRVVAAGGVEEELVEDGMHVGDFAIAPDGERVLLLAPSTPGDLAGPTGAWLWRPGAEPRLLTGDLNVGQEVNGDSRYGAQPGKPVWGADGTVTLLINEAGRSLLNRLDTDSGEMTRLHEGDRVVTGFSAGTDGASFVFVAEDPRRPGEVHFMDAVAERRVTSFNDDFVERYRPLGPESAEIPSESAAGEAIVPWWLLRPTTPREDGAVVLQVHGGPHTNYGYGFVFEFQLLAARGYAVAFGNPRGSSGYGADFARALLGRYGTVDADDVMAIARAARGAADVPVHLTGGSYGGFMTNWLVGRTDFFRSAVTQRSICNFVSFYGTSDIGYRFAEYEVGGNAWDDTRLLWEQSPLKDAARVTTPILIIHSEQDLRCGIEQAEQWFVALKRIGRVDTRLVRFPDESHDLSRSGRPDRRIQRLEEIVGWFESHP